ncbi:MAG: MmgE/PrpD family protein, partial [Pikeienuella sp.]
GGRPMTAQEQYWRDFAAWAAAPFTAPAAAETRAIDAFIDTAACIIAGQATPAAQSAATVAQGHPALTAMALATAAHALDWDDYDAPSIAHPSAVLVPTLLALPNISGRTAIDAFLIGLEAMDRMGEVINPAHYERGWHATATLGGFGAAASAGHALNLNADQMLTALSLAAGAAGGLKAQFGFGAKPLNAGLAAKTGILSAQMAQAGLTARGEAIWGAQGLAGLYGPPGAQNTIPSAPPGEPLMIENHGLIAKPHPCCGYIARIIDEMITLATTPGFDPQNIDRIQILAPPRNAAILGFITPANPDEARFCPPYCVAATLLRGHLSPEDFTEKAIHRPEILALATRISFASTQKAQSPHDLSPNDPDEIDIWWKDGGHEHRKARIMKGDPDAPMTRADFLNKLAAAGGSAALRAILPKLASAPNLNELCALFLMDAPNAK